MIAEKDNGAFNLNPLMFSRSLRRYAAGGGGPWGGGNGEVEVTVGGQCKPDPGLKAPPRAFKIRLCKKKGYIRVKQCFQLEPLGFV